MNFENSYVKQNYDEKHHMIALVTKDKSLRGYILVTIKSFDKSALSELLDTNSGEYVNNSNLQLDLKTFGTKIHFVSSLKAAQLTTNEATDEDGEPAGFHFIEADAKLLESLDIAE